MHATETRPDFRDSEAYNFQNQEQLLQSMIAEIQRAIMEHRASDAARDILARLASATEHAFVREEGLMEAVGYTGFEVHREQHRELSHQLHSFIQRAPKSNGAIGFELKIFLRAWLAQHVNEADRLFVDYVSNLGRVDSTPNEQRPWWRVW